MDNEELKKKIIDVLRDNCEYALRYYPNDNYTYEAIADALIEAGLSADVQSLADGNCVLYAKGKGFMRLYNEQDINKMIHHVEVAERAFKELCIDKIFGQNDEPSIKWMWEFYKARAEKELAEEMKNEQMR